MNLTLTKLGLYCILEVDGVDPVMATFQVCDINADDGLIMEEIKQDGCKEVLQKLFGLSSDVLQDTFFQLDENMDQVISREEGHATSQSLDRLGQISQPPTTFGNKVLVATGSMGGTSLLTEIIDLKNSSFSCTKVGRFPTPLFWANGGWVGNKPMVCGGLSTKTGSWEKNCYTLQGNGAWKEVEEARLYRKGQYGISRSVVINDQLFIAQVSKKPFMMNYEMVAPNNKSWGYIGGGSGSWEKVPSPLYGTCIVKWDANIIMLIGASSDRKATFFINMKYNIITPGPKLTNGRIHHACHEITVKGKSFIVVTGGYGRFEKSTEMLPKSSPGKGWQKGKTLKII